MARHHEVNDLVWPALCKANVPSVKERHDLVRDDVKRPDGSTLIPWLAGKSMAWVVTMGNTLAESYIPSYLCQSRRCSGAYRGQKVIRILDSAILPHPSTSDSWPYKHRRHLIAFGVRTQTDGCFRRPA